MKQLVRLPTRADQILDLIITNLPQLYNKDSVQTYPPFGLSDHNAIVLQPKARPPRTSSRRVVYRRDTRPSRKLELGRYLSSIDWSILDVVLGCEDMVRLFVEFIRIGLDIIMPLKKVTLHVDDPPWITAEFKNIIKLRQKAFANGDMEQYRHYRNLVNRERKICRSKFFSRKVQHLKETKPSQWWREVKQLSGMVPATGPEDLCSQLHLDGIDNLSHQEIASLINNAFLEPMQAYQPLDYLPPFEADSLVPELTAADVCSALLSLNPRKASGPDGVPNWLLKEYAEVLAHPVCSVINSSFAEQKLPSSWKFADVIPLLKTKPVTDVSKHLRPISLTPAISKVAEDFVVGSFVGPAVLDRIDVDQFGAIPKSSTTQALISMVHKWSQATDATGAAVRVVLFDYRKAFDLIDHRLLVDKVYSLPIPRGIARWICDFLMDRKQRVKLSTDCVSEWGDVPSGVPQGTKLGPWLFLLMINDLRIQNVCTWKYVDDTTVAEIVPRGANSQIQNIVDVMEDWSLSNKLQLNAAKCKELVIDFKTNKHSFDPVIVNGEVLPMVTHAKILGVTLSHDLLWNVHLDEVIKKANKRLYFLVLLKRASVPAKEIVNFYCTCIRPVLEYCSPVFHHSLPIYLSDELERVQKRALNIISPGESYQHNLDEFSLCRLYSRRVELCKKLFNSMVNTPSHKLYDLLPPRHVPKYNLRRNRKFNLPSIHTNRFQKTFIPTMCRH